MNPSQVVFVVVLVCALSFAQELSDQHLKTLMVYHDQCKAETNIDDAMATGILTGSFPDNPVLKNHMFCLSKKIGIQKDNGEIQKDHVKETIARIINDENEIDQLTETCSVQKDSPEETAFQLAKCVYEGTHP